MNDIYNNKERVCPVCDKNEKKLLFKQYFSAISNNTLMNGYDVVSCENCGFCFADQIPGQELFNLYYREMSKYEKNEHAIQENRYESEKFNQMVSYIVPFLESYQTHILEIGCSTGHLLALIKRKGYENILGVDPSPACARTAEKLYGIRVLTNTLSNLSIEKQSTDFLILAGVLEHVKELDISLKHLWNVLSLNGKIYISVPDASQYLNGEDAPFQEFSVEHINFFGPTSLTNMMNKNGFTLVDYKQNIFEVSNNTLTPVIQAVYEKTHNFSTHKYFITDKETKKNLESYVNLCNQREKAIYQIINEIILSHKPIIVWGTGTQTLRLLASSRIREAKIVAFVDSNPKFHDKTLNGITIVSPESLKNMKESILISSRIYQNDIEHQIRNILQLDNEIIKLY
jgi:2-polyprenyl-3-methyl-5-hydroxy-6-metoxy-1,4-benzoquinol methylase